MKKAMSKQSIFTRRAFLRSCGLMGLGLAAAGAVPSVVRAAAGTGDKTVSRTLPLMGTFVSITAVHPSADLAEEAVGRAFGEMERMIGIFDRHQGGTALSVLNQDGRLAGAPGELRAVIERALSLHNLSSGAFDPTVAPLVDAMQARQGKDLSGAELRELMALVHADQVRISGRDVALGREGMGLTLDGIAKGFIADRASMALTAAGVTNHLVDAGGDIRTSGAKAPGHPWQVAVQDPDKTGNYPAVLSMRNGAIATSGNYERFYDKNRAHHHVVEPGSGASPHEVAGCTVLAPTVMEADALATTVMVLGARAGMSFVDSLPGRECLLVTAGGARLTSRNWS